MLVELLVHQRNQEHTVDVQARDLVQTQTPAVPAQQRHQGDANREPHWAEDT